MIESQSDMWSQWLLRRRFGGDARRLKEMLDWLYPVRDRILSRIQLGDGETLLDVGRGDGLIAFAALDKFPTCCVIFSDISDDLLSHVRLLAQDMHVENRCQFVRASADNLSLFADESIEAVTTRSVLIYVSAKQQAFDEFYRVLKPGGRVSLFEPINRFAYPEPPDRFNGYDIRPVIDIAQKLKAVYEQIQPPATDPMTDFDERDLIVCAETAGFTTVNLELHVEIKPPDNADWEVMIHTAGNPKIPTLAEAMQQTLTQSELDAFINHLRPLVETRQGTQRCAMAYLWAAK